MLNFLQENVNNCKLISQFVSASLGTSFPRLPTGALPLYPTGPSPHHGNPLHCEILSTPMYLLPGRQTDLQSIHIPHGTSFRRRNLCVSTSERPGKFADWNSTGQSPVSTLSAITIRLALSGTMLSQRTVHSSFHRSQPFRSPFCCSWWFGRTIEQRLQLSNRAFCVAGPVAWKLQSTTGHSFGAYIINFQKHAQYTPFLTFLLHWLTVSQNMSSEHCTPFYYYYLFLET